MIQTDTSALEYRNYVNKKFGLKDFDAWVNSQLDLKDDLKYLDVGCGVGKHLLEHVSSHYGQKCDQKYEFCAKNIVSLPRPAPNSTILVIFFSLKDSRALTAAVLGERPNISDLFEKLASQCRDC